MNDPALLLVCLDFALIGALPRIFFRRDGRFNARWWLTAGPLFAAPALLLAARLGAAFATPWPLPPRAGAAGALLATVLATASIGLISMTLGTHRIPIALWHQENDAPRGIVTWGPYARIRHPFYASFLVALLAALALHPHPALVALLAWEAVALNLTAAREERRLLASEFGAEYRALMATTGRFLPRPRRPA